MCLNRCDASLTHKLDRGRQPRQAEHVVVSRFIFVRQSFRLLVLLTDGARSPTNKGTQLLFHSRPNVEHSRPQWAEQPLVAWRGEQVDAQLLDVDWHMPQRLR